jgi:hypothetical protein
MLKELMGHSRSTTPPALFYEGKRQVTLLEHQVGCGHKVYRFGVENVLPVV